MKCLPTWCDCRLCNRNSMWGRLLTWQIMFRDHRYQTERPKLSRVTHGRRRAEGHAQKEGPSEPGCSAKVGEGLPRVRKCWLSWTVTQDRRQTPPSDSLQPHGLYVAHQAPLSMGFSRQGYWSGLLFPSPGYLPNPGIKVGSPALQADSLPSEPLGKPDTWA